MANAHDTVRIYTAPDPGAAEGSPVSAPVRAARLAAYAASAGLMAYFLSVGTMESRVQYLFSFALCLVNPVWGFYALALMGPLYLMDPGNTHLLAGLEVFAIGIIAGELRSIGAARHDPLHPAPDSGSVRVFWGLWPYFAGGLLLAIAAASLPGILLVVRQEDPGNLAPNFLKRTFDYMFYGAATVPQWTLRAQWNWTTGIAIAAIAARRADTIVAARWLKIGGISMLVACVFSLLDWAGWLPLTHIRRPNPDPLHADRLQGLAGHAGWFAEWITLMWPGVALWWSVGRGRRNWAVAAGLALAGLALVLTAARAAWLAAIVSSAFGTLFLLRSFPAARRPLRIAAAVGAAVVVIGVIGGGDKIAWRLANLLRAQDRANYYVSGLQLLREKPFGIGLGTHYQFYEDRFTPFWRWYQVDHVTSHSLWLHTMIECGPMVPLLLLLGLLGVAAEMRLALRRMDPHARTIYAALAMVLLSIVTVSIAQYTFYLRINDLCFWIALGLAIGIARKARAAAAEDVLSTRGRRLLLVCLVGAALTATFNLRGTRDTVAPRLLLGDGQGGLAFWTGTRWRTPVDGRKVRVSFSLYRKATPAQVRVTWPDGKAEEFALNPEETRTFEWNQPPRDDAWYSAPRELTIECTPAWTPADALPGSTDRRALGVYVAGLNMESAKSD